MSNYLLIILKKFNWKLLSNENYCSWRGQLVKGLRREHFLSNSQSYLQHQQNTDTPGLYHVPQRQFKSFLENMKMMTSIASQEFVGVSVQLGDKDRLERYKNKASFATQNSLFSVSFEINKSKIQDSTQDDGVDNEACLEHEIGT